MFRSQRQIQVKLRKVADGCLFGAAFFLAYAVRTHPLLDPGGKIYPFSYYAWLLLLIVPLGPFFLELEGFYHVRVLNSRVSTLLQLAKVATWISLTLVVALFLRKAEVARGLPILFVPSLVFLVSLKEEIVLRLNEGHLGSKSNRRRLIILSGRDEGGNPEPLSLERALGLTSMAGVEIVAKLDLATTAPSDLAEQLHRTSANAVVVSPRQAPFGQIEQAIQVCELEGVEVWLIAEFFQTRISQTVADELNGHPVLVFRTGPHASWQAIAKGAMDRVGSLVLLVVASPIMLIAALAIRFGSQGPIFFRQKRAGLNGQPFWMLKFRTMVTNAEQLKQELASLNEMSGPVFKVTNDPRVTSIGRFLRKWSIDELPQLWNVFRGEMSLVGPRPLPVDEVARFDDPAHRRRLSVKPGLTCLWQVSGRNNVRDFKEWVRLDLEYIDNWTIWLDVRILFRTIPAVFTTAGAK